MNHHLGDQFAVLSLFYDIDYIYFLYQKVYKLRGHFFKIAKPFKTPIYFSSGSLKMIQNKPLKMKTVSFLKNSLLQTFFGITCRSIFCLILNAFSITIKIKGYSMGVFFNTKYVFPTLVHGNQIYFKLIFNNFKYTCMYDCVENEDFNNKLFLKYSFHNVPFRLKSKTNLKLCFFMK